MSGSPVPDGLSERIFSFLFRKRLPLGQGLQALRIGRMYLDPVQLLAQLLPGIGDDVISGIRAEYLTLKEEAVTRYSTATLEFPPYWRMGENSVFLAYAIVRLRRPRTVLETGVANGHSTFFLLKALQMNKYGALWSTDISSRAGCLISPNEREGWHLEVLSRDNVHRAFQRVVDKMGEVGLFIHDSGGHKYQLQMSEYQTVYPRMSTGAILASDDVNSSYAFVDAASSFKASPFFLFDLNEIRQVVKIFGLF